MGSHCMKMHSLSMGFLNLSIIGWLLLCMVFCISGDDNFTNSAFDAMTTDSFTEIAANRGNSTHQDILGSPSNGSSANLERQKKENRFGDSGEDVKDVRYGEKDEMVESGQEGTTTEVITDSPFIPPTKMIGPRIERVMERYLITPEEEAITTDVINQPASLPPEATITTTSSTKILTEPIEAPTVGVSVSPAITSENFDEIVLNSNTTWVIQFYSTTCAGCMVSLKNLTETTKNLPKGVNYAAINVGEQRDFIKRFKLTELPHTKIFYPKGTVRVVLPNPVVDNVNTLPSSVDTFGTTVFPKKSLIFSTNLTNASTGVTKLPQVKTPGRELLHGNDSRIKMKQLDSSTKPTHSDADAKSLNEALHALLIYAIFKRIWKCIFIYFVNAFVNYPENPDM